ncbi:hypothetical protein K0M31_019818 [Melipona bicolor]|uniref:Furin n=1 Tax=Melipona bicolor TaxID=60889 RepID=A0AA40G3J5_9HYME|nr:hypothetical protein K0M31_019818 [Melipona bicolor]
MAVCNFSECKLNWYYYDGVCVSKCPSGTYGFSDEAKAVCTDCHYSCLTCSGSSNTDCVSCHEDAELSTNLGEPVCVLRELSWTMRSTLWFYQMTVLFSVNVVAFGVIILYMMAKWYLRRRNSKYSEVYGYYKVLYTNDVNACKDGSQEGACLSDSE